MVEGTTWISLHGLNSDLWLVSASMCWNVEHDRLDLANRQLHISHPWLGKKCRLRIHMHQRKVPPGASSWLQAPSELEIGRIREYQQHGLVKLTTVQWGPHPPYCHAPHRAPCLCLCCGWCTAADLSGEAEARPGSAALGPSQCPSDPALAKFVSLSSCSAQFCRLHLVVHVMMYSVQVYACAVRERFGLAARSYILMHCKSVLQLQMLGMPGNRPAALVPFWCPWDVPSDCINEQGR